MSTHDLKDKILGMLGPSAQPGPQLAVPGMSGRFQINCDQCDAPGPAIDSSDALAQAQSAGLTKDEDIEKFVLNGLRTTAFSQGWIERDGKDYCAKCTKEGKVAGDNLRPARRAVRRFVK